jgi:hypothetical protein
MQPAVETGETIMTTTGGCLCGAVRYEIEGDPLLSAVCHCRNCQKQAGSAMSVLIGVADAQMTITGEMKTYEDKGESGDPVWRRFCGNCGSPILSDLPSQQGLHFVKAGTLDDVSGLEPKLHFWTVSAQPWVRFADDAVKFDKTPG